MPNLLAISFEGDLAPSFDLRCLAPGRKPPDGWDHSHKNKWTVFCTTWHPGTLARLSDADLAEAWRLADYLYLDESCSSVLQDVAVQ